MVKQFFSITFVLSLVFAFSARAAEKGVNIFASPRPLPESTIMHESGARLKLSDFKGDFVVAVFWSRSCPPCLKELRSLNGFYNKVKGSGVRLVLISPSQEWASVEEQRRFLRRFGAKDVDFFVDENGRVAANFGIFTSPHTVLINKKGEEFGRIRGSAKWDDDKVIEYIYELKAQANAQ